MTWATIRRATTEDVQNLRNRAEAFLERHEMPSMGILTPTDAVESQIDHMVRGYGVSLEEQSEGKRLRRLWLAVVRRALKESRADGIAHGHVGYAVD